MKICIVTGGSGGHIYPALTFSDYVRDTTDYDISYIGNGHKMESKIIPKANYPFYAINNQGLQGTFFDKIQAVFGQFNAIRQARAHLKRIRPDVVFSFGGYVSLPVVLAAKSLSIKIVLHEQNAFVGKANKWVSGFADAIFTCYEASFKNKDNVYLFGNPRASLALNVQKDPFELNRIGLSKDKKIVLCVMGSQGSMTMNEIFKETLSIYSDINYQIVFVTGPLEYDSFMRDVHTIPDNVFIEGFVDQAKLIPYVDLIVARAGASTITEIAAFGLPSILIPSPYVANNHQYFNAKALVDKNATILLEEKDCTAHSFIDRVEHVLSDKELMETLGKNVKGFDTPHVNGNILKIIEKVVRDE